MRIFRSIPFELLVWVSALILLAFTDPNLHHFSLCPLENLGFSWCPGCGLGRSISFIFHGDFRASFNQHSFGIPALVILLNRIYTLALSLFQFNLIKS